MNNTVSPDSQSPIQVAVRPSLLPETRGLVLHLYPKMRPEEIALAVERGARAGFNLLAVRVFSRGLTVHPSEVMASYRLPRQSRKFRGWDALASCSDATQSHDMLLYAILEVLCPSDRIGTRARPILSRYPQWGMRNQAGAVVPVGTVDSSVFLCPFNPEVRRFVGDLVCELLEGYPVSGVVFDFVPFPLPGSDPKAAFCFCPSCKSQVASDLTIDLETLDFNTQGQAVAKWMSWKRERLSSTLAYWRLRIRRVRESIPLIIQVANSTLLRKPVANDSWDYAALLEEGYLEEALVPGYSSDPEKFHAEVDHDIIELSENVALLPLVNAASTETLSQFAEHIRRVPLPGAVYDLGKPLTEEESVEIGERIFGEPAIVSELQPLTSAINLIEHLVKLIPTSTNLCNFFKDLLKFLNMAGPELSLDQVYHVMENIQGIERQIRAGEIRVEEPAEPVLRNLSLARRMLRLLTL
jgi:hypothetical protein